MLSGVMAKGLEPGKIAGDECGRDKRHFRPPLDWNAAKRGEAHDEMGFGRNGSAEGYAVRCS